MHNFMKLAALTVLLSASALAQNAVKVGFVSTLSGPGSGLGVDARDGFNLALKHLGNKLGGLPVEISFSDDKQDADTARQAVDKAIKRDKVDFLTGIIFSNLLLAVGDTVFDSKTPYISLNAGPSQYAGSGCNAYFYNVAWQNDNLHEAMGKYVNSRKFSDVYILAPNYPAGKDALTGFKRFFKGKITAEVYTKVNQLDFAAEIAQIRAARPKAVYTFQPGGSGINFIKQYAEAGLLKEIPLFLPGFSADADVIKAVGPNMVGIFNTSQWAMELSNPTNAKFVADFKATYGRNPSLYAAQGYDAALLMSEAVKDVKGNLSDGAALRKALENTSFISTHGAFKFNKNHYPVQDIYLRQVAKVGGSIQNRLVGKVFSNHEDAYAKDRKMK
ncbi:ABC transporter substrate-binding protein [Deinococcus sp.]|uniref:ABC transporter substrate-binding protein n=1 Tax=Deinococcus sp. TaxID=47478 RepID=UPI0025C54CEF|nr:ABC transporter substrate-binding protein [Deinococcus sp.]